MYIATCTVNSSLINCNPLCALVLLSTHCQKGCLYYGNEECVDSDNIIACILLLSSSG